MTGGTVGETKCKRMEELKLFEIEDDCETVLRREWAMPNGNTFEIPPIKRLVERECMKKRCGTIIDPLRTDHNTEQ